VDHLYTRACCFGLDKRLQLPQEIDLMMHSSTFFHHTHIYINAIHHSIGPSPEPANQPNDQANPIDRTRVGHVRPRAPRVGHLPCAVLFFQAARLHALRPSLRALDRADRARLLIAQPFFIFAQSFYYFISHFATNELSHFTYVNKSFLLLLLSYFYDFSAVTQSFYDHVNHFATLDSVIFCRVFRSAIFTQWLFLSS
jgi:hypothetical protein